MSQDDSADRLAAFLDALDVESLWIAGHHVNWENGEPDAPNLDGSEADSHCSAFVAALAERLGIYVLRPPDYPQELLANRQVHWLDGEHFIHAPDEASSLGWQPLGSSGDDGATVAAVAAAQAGKLVVAGFAEPAGDEDDDCRPHVQPGHICIIRPQLDPIGVEGPLVSSAGEQNWRKAHMAHVFAAHAGAWPNAIRLFVHGTDFSGEAG